MLKTRGRGGRAKPQRASRTKVRGRRVCFKPECDAIIGLLSGPFCALEVGL